MTCLPDHVAHPNHTIRRRWKRSLNGKHCISDSKAQLYLHALTAVPDYALDMNPFASKYSMIAPAIASGDCIVPSVSLTVMVTSGLGGSS